MQGHERGEGISKSASEMDIAGVIMACEGDA